MQTEVEEEKERFTTTINNNDETDYNQFDGVYEDSDSDDDTIMRRVEGSQGSHHHSFI